MTSETTTATFITLTAADGKILTDGATWAYTVACPDEAAAARWREVDESEKPDTPSEDTTERDNAEKAIVRRVAALAVQYGALQELATMDVTVPNLLELAARKGVTDADMISAKSDVSILVLDLMAKAGGDWATCWDGLKSRFRKWMVELQAPA